MNQVYLDRLTTARDLASKQVNDMIARRDKRDIPIGFTPGELEDFNFLKGQLNALNFAIRTYEREQ